MKSSSALDNPIWNALTTGHRNFARINGQAARYPSDVSPMAAMAEPTLSAFADLAGLVRPGEGVALFTPQPLEVPREWEVKRSLCLRQMVQSEPIQPPAFDLVTLGPADVPAILELIALAQPGPFLTRTIEMGSYFGIRDRAGQLVAMAGERLGLAEFTEISAVCTHPDFRGRGYGQALVSYVAANIRRAGKTPFLHVLPENPAIRVYEKAGLTIRANLMATMLARR